MLEVLDYVIGMMQLEGLRYANNKNIPLRASSTSCKRWGGHVGTWIITISTSKVVIMVVVNRT